MKIIPVLFALALPFTAAASLPVLDLNSLSPEELAALRAGPIEFPGCPITSLVLERTRQAELARARIESVTKYLNQCSAELQRLMDQVAAAGCVQQKGGDK